MPTFDLSSTDDEVAAERLAIREPTIAAKTPERFRPSVRETPSLLDFLGQVCRYIVALALYVFPVLNRFE
jgi:hypothetical protein